MEFKMKMGRYIVTQKSHAHVADIIWKKVDAVQVDLLKLIHGILKTA